MLIQGANNPLRVLFSESVESIPRLVFSLWYNDTRQDPIKIWQETDATISGDTALLPITEDETRQIEARPVYLLVKGLDKNGLTIFWNRYDMSVMDRRDRDILLTRAGG